uniref:CE1759 family FMN reductase n=1 Tax=Nakamurella sp. TaxID=1869182 RepID=UPI003B3B5F72
MTTYTVAVVTAGLSDPSSTRLLGDRLAQAVRRDGARRGVRVEIVDVPLRDLARPIADTFVTGFAPPALQAALESVYAADALIAVTPVFSASYSGLFKSFFDAADPQGFVGKPVLLAATGGSARHSLVLDHALRPLFAYLKAEPVATGVFAATADFGAGTDSAAGDLDRRIERAGSQLLTALAAAAPSVVTPPAAAAEPPPDLEDEIADDAVQRAARVHLGPEPSRVEARRR